MIDAPDRVLDMHDQSQSARLVYLALREDGAMTGDELADAVGVSRPAASRCARALADSDWARERTRQSDGRGPSPSEWHALVECDHCGDRFLESGLPQHTAHCDDDNISAYALQDMTPADIGLSDDKPKPKRGIQ